MKKIIIAFATLSLIFACKNKENTKNTTLAYEVVENEKIKRLDSLYTSHLKRNEFNGNVLVAEGGKIIFQKSYGIANEETNQETQYSDLI